MTSSDSQIDKPRHRRPERAELSDANIKTQASKALTAEKTTIEYLDQTHEG